MNATAGSSPTTSAGAPRRIRRPLIELLAGCLALLLGAALSPARAPAQSTAPISLATEIQLQSEVLGDQRTIQVALPEDYDQGGDARYPVLYMLDGMQNLRHVAGSAEVLARTGQIPPLIIVGIETDNRMRDYTPSAVDEVPYSGGGPTFLEFITNEVIPHVEANYRTHPFRILEGHSLGGLFTADALMRQPDAFDAYVVMSPSFWWNGEEPARNARRWLGQNRALEASIFFGIGADDGVGMQAELERFVDTLEEQPRDGLRWDHRVFQGEGHMSAPLLVNYYGLKFVFDEMRLPERLLSTFDDEAFRDHEASIMERFGSAARQSGETYIMLGLRLLEEGDAAGAITVFRRNAEAYPIFPPNYAWLGDAYEANGQTGEALASYREALRRSRAINYGQEQAYSAEIERLEGMSRPD